MHEDVIALAGVFEKGLQGRAFTILAWRAVFWSTVLTRM
jgi:hypothetical protein